MFMFKVDTSTIKNTHISIDVSPNVLLCTDNRNTDMCFVKYACHNSHLTEVNTAGVDLDLTAVAFRERQTRQSNDAIQMCHILVF